jgi:mitotic spindle assembly checkpoint protein MAD2B
MASIDWMTQNKQNAQVDLLCEFLETIIPSILYVRNVYPKELFTQKRTESGQVFFASKHSDLSQYIGNLVLSIKPWLLKNLVEKVCLIIIDQNHVPLEEFVFEIDIEKEQSTEWYSSLLWLLRDCYVKTNICHALLEPNPNDISFTVRLFLKPEKDLQLSQNLEWVLVTTESNEKLSNEEKNLIHPLRSINHRDSGVKMQMYVREFKDAKQKTVSQDSINSSKPSNSS